MSKRLFCSNCLKLGHSTKSCNDPILSYGVICIKIDGDLNINSRMLEKFLVNKTIDIDDFNFLNISNFNKIDYYKDKIKFLLVQRKHSFSYVEFMRGKYDEKNKVAISNLLNLMTLEELNAISMNDFQTLWNNLWKKTAKHKAFQKEYEMAESKFTYLKENYDFYELIDYEKLYDTPEWGFPKGRKDRNEKNIDCAIREFREETSVNNGQYTLLSRLPTVEENVIDEDNTHYKLIYYLGLAYDDVDVGLRSEEQKSEIGDIKWLSFTDIISKIRPYFDEKIKIVHKVFFLFLNIIECIRNQNSFDNNYGLLS
jgi:8-oxo-dGTP pyrophosphatase MutT (NUDIX family)